MEFVNVQDHILLSICIPTYNRGNMLEYCLDSIVRQDGFDRRTEVIILDNHSTDNTAEIAKKFAIQNPNIFYFSNEENIGMEKNIIKVLGLASGKLIKLLNDYSIFRPDSLKFILEQIVNNEKERSILYFQNRSSIRTFQYCTNLNQFFQIVTYWPTWIGTFSIWQDDFKKFDKFDVFEGLFFPHLLMLLQVFDSKGKLIILNVKLFEEVAEVKKGGYSFFDVFLENFTGSILHDLYNRKRISWYTLIVVKRDFLRKFIKYWLSVILVSGNSEFDKSRFNLLFRFYCCYPELYLILFCLKLEQFRNSVISIVYSNSGFKNMFRATIKYMFSIVTRVISYEFFEKIQNIFHRFYTLWIRTEFHSFGSNSIINYPLNLKGGKFIRIGSGVCFGKNCVINAWSHYQSENFKPAIIIDDGVNIGEACHISAINSVFIGKNVLMGRRITIVDNSHGEFNKSHLYYPPIERKLVSKGPVIIGENVWIGDKATILSGVTIGANSVVGAHTLVNVDIPSNCLVGGVPCRVIKMLTDTSC